MDHAIHHWRKAPNHFTILWPERMPALEELRNERHPISTEMAGEGNCTFPDPI
jgi:hypothetical protein